MRLLLEELRIFLKVAEVASFTRAAEQLRVPKSSVSQSIARLERDVGARLFLRTTRRVRLTADGEVFLPRAGALVRDAEELGHLFVAKKALRGRVRIDLPVGLARSIVLPSLPGLLSEHPGLELQVSATDRFTDVVKEGFDCVLRVGALSPSELVAQRIGMLPVINVASPSYLQKFGTPKELEDLNSHYVVHYSSNLGSEAPSFEYMERTRLRSRRVRCLVTVNNSDAFHAACLAGLGIAQMPALGIAARLGAGELVPVLSKYAAPSLAVWLVHPYAGQLPLRVRIVAGWLRSVVSSALEASHDSSIGRPAATAPKKGKKR